jgi:cobalt/nickel transport system ATP-binding protein
MISMPTGIKIENLSFSYDHGKKVLNNVTIEIKPGERFGIIGPSGAGKSTLLLHLNGILSGQGTVRIGETIVNKQSIPDVRRQVGLVFQNPDDQLFNPTVEEDVAFGPLNFGLNRETVSERVHEALKAMNLVGFEKLTSHHLSLGERKRVALATVLAMRPEVIALDEPFSNLDPAMVMQLMTILKALDATLVLVSQSILPIVASCDRMAILKEGKVVAIGPPKQLAADVELMRSSGLDLSFYWEICKEIFNSPPSDSPSR